MAQISDLGIDLGTSHVIIYMKGKGVVLREPAVVAVDRDTSRILAVGEEAYQLIGRTPGKVQAIRPLRQGTIVDQQLLQTMIHEFVGSIIGRRIINRPRAVVSVPSGVSEVEKRMVIATMFDAGVRRTQLLERPIAAALGAELPFDQPYGSMIVDMGAGVTDIAVLSSGAVEVSAAVPFAGDAFDDALVRYLRRKHNLLIGERTAEEIKINLGSATPPVGSLEMDVAGRNLVSGLPKTMTVSAAEVHEAIKDTVADLIEAIQSVLEQTFPQLASDIFEDGITFTGGAAQLQGLAEAVESVLKVPCVIADDPQISVAMGCGHALEDSPAMRALLNDRRRWIR